MRDTGQPYQTTGYRQHSFRKLPVRGPAEVDGAQPLDRAWRLSAAAEPDRRDDSSARHEHAHPAMNRRICEIMRKVGDLGRHRRTLIGSMLVFERGECRLSSQANEIQAT